MSKLYCAKVRRQCILYFVTFLKALTMGKSCLKEKDFPPQHYVTANALNSQKYCEKAKHFSSGN